MQIPFKYAPYICPKREQARRLRSSRPQIQSDFEIGSFYWGKDEALCRFLKKIRGSV